MFKQFFDAFWPKVVEFVAEQGLNNLLNIKDSKHNFENLKKNLELLSAKAIDVETEIKSREDSGQKKRKREVEEWLEEVKEIKNKVDELRSEGIIKKLFDGGNAAQLNDDINKLVQQRLDFGEPVLDARGTTGETLLTNGMVGKDFNENLERIWRLLEDRQVSMIGLYGMGGVGKTTLAKHVYNRLVQEYDGRVVWVTVSQVFTIKSLQDKIACFLGVKLEDEDEEAFRATRLNRFLSEKKISMLMLDDVWENIDMERVGCNFSRESCRLIVTTRSVEVCRRIGCDIPISVVKLGKDEAWKLFLRTLENETELGPEVVEIAKSMAEVCEGLPLGIITLARSMKGETDIHMWKNAATELKYCVSGQQNDVGEVDEVFKVLKYSFDRLKMNCESESNEPNMIQHCFLYCSLYPEDYSIDRDDLVKKFISEGLLNERRSRRSQVEQGHSILDTLVNLCLLEKSYVRRVFTGESKESVKMHDLLRSMALKICKRKYMVRAGEQSLKEIPNQEEWTEDLEKVSLVQCGIESIGEGVSPNCPKLSTLLLWGSWRLELIPDSFFSKMKGLCTLDLCENEYITMLPNSVSELKNLKSLLLENCKKLKTVPNLGRLKALRELNLSGTAIEEVPQGLEELCMLRFFSVNADELKLFPKGLLLKLGHLEHLNLPIHLQVEIEEMESLKQLEEFGGGMKNVSDFNWFITNHNTCCYSIGIDSKYAFYTPKRKLEDLGCKNNELVLYGSNVRDENVLGKDIAHLNISACKGLSQCFVNDLTSRFDNPTSLRSLEIEYCGGIECIWRTGLHGVGLQASQVSETLEDIYLKGLDDVKGVVMMQRGEIGTSTSALAQLLVFSSLKSLVIPNLESIKIHSCGEIEEIFKEDEGRDVVATLPKLEYLELSGNPRLRKVGLAASGVPNLEEIDIRDCAEIEEIFKEEEEGRAASILRLRYLYLRKLPKLKKVGLATSLVPNIEHIAIDDCGELEEAFEDKGRDAVTKFKKLELEKVPRLRKLGLPLSRAPNLEEISIKECGIEEIFEEDEGRDHVTTFFGIQKLELRKLPRVKKLGLPASALPNIEKIIMESCGEIEVIFKEDEGRDVVATLLKFKKLELNKLPRLRKLGLQLSRAPNLEQIDVVSCGIEEIFEEDEGRDVVATLPKLECLLLSRNPRLRKVGLTTSGVPNLKEIVISYCGEVEEIFKEEDEGREAVTTLPKFNKLELNKVPRLRKLGLPLSRAPNLKKISIEECGIEEIFEEDEGRYHVTTFSEIRKLELRKLPRVKKLGLPASALPNLERIRIESCGEIEKIFKEEDEGRHVVTTLPKLKELRLRENPRLRKVGLAASGVPNLEEIIIWDCGEIEEIFKEEDEGRFPKLKRLKLTNLPRLGNLGLLLSRAPNLEKFSIGECGIEEIFEKYEGRDVVVTTFSKIRKLKLCTLPRVKRLGLPASALSNLGHIHIKDCEEIKEIFNEDEGRDVFATLPKLKVLWLFRNPRLRKVGIAASGVPNLKEIEIMDCEEIEEIFKEDEGRDAVTKLKKLKLTKLPRVKKLGLPASALPNLGEINIRDCKNIEEIFEEEDEGRDVVATLPKLKRLLLSGNPRLRKVGLAASGVRNLEGIDIMDCEEIEEIFKEEDEGRAASIVTTLHKFTSLSLSMLPRLRSVSNATMICNSIEYMLIRNCPRLMNKLPVDMSVAPPPSLRRLCVDREWWESLEWDKPELPQLFQYVLRFNERVLTSVFPA